MSDIVQYETQGRVAVITLNRPEARNAVNGDVASGMEAAIDQMEADPEVWVGVPSSHRARVNVGGTAFARTTVSPIVMTTIATAQSPWLLETRFHSPATGFPK